MIDIISIELIIDTRAIVVIAKTESKVLYSVESTPSGWELIESLNKFLIEQHHILVNRLNLEKVILSIGYAIQTENDDSIEVLGRNITSGLPKRIDIYSHDVEDATFRLLKALVEKIAMQVNDIVSKYAEDWQIKNDILLRGEFRHWKLLDIRIQDAINSKTSMNFNIVVSHPNKREL